MSGCVVLVTGRHGFGGFPQETARLFPLSGYGNMVGTLLPDSKQWSALCNFKIMILYYNVLVREKAIIGWRVSIGLIGEDKEVRY